MAIKTEKIELQLLIETLKQCYSYDLTNYAQASLLRRVRLFTQKINLSNISEIIPRIIHCKEFFSEFCQFITVNVTEFFRDPHIFKELREKCPPEVGSFPALNIWHARCSSGEEVYSMAILLKETGLYNKSHLYATDINQNSLQQAQEGIYPIEHLKSGNKNYHLSGGKNSLSDFYHAKYEHVIFNSDLQKNITFAQHNLTHDTAFNQMQMIICRNVFIYFNNDLQNKVLELFDSCLAYNGLLWLGSKESLDFTKIRHKYSPLSEKNRIYKKIS